jgi:uncharacterized protein (DUF2132 family)
MAERKRSKADLSASTELVKFLKISTNAISEYGVDAVNNHISSLWLSQKSIKSEILFIEKMVCDELNITQVYLKQNRRYKSQLAKEICQYLIRENIPKITFSDIAILYNRNRQNVCSDYSRMKKIKPDSEYNKSILSMLAKFQSKLTDRNKK